LLVFFTVGISLLLSTLFIRYRDIKFIVQALTPLWFYATPIIYTRSLLPGWMSEILQFNPMTGIIELFQSVFTNNNLILDFHAIIFGFLISLLILIVGIYLFIKENQFFDDWL